MLILTRRPTQAVTIGSDVTVTVLEVRGNRVRFGVDAPRDTAVRRVARPEKVRSHRAPDVDH